jgi:hypothetical protein
VSARRSPKSEVKVHNVTAGSRETIGLNVGQRATISTLGIARVAVLTSLDVPAEHFTMQTCSDRSYGPWSSFKYVIAEAVAKPAQIEIW